ncbi:MAG TPA: prepilin-type N-terminal cleavage/methylation domain-containing protein [Phycisphaerales bacterium]|nr:prepilin-type N-terminal cleavage/methylation domain-containing protein [Phycisphaerales bacterium]
MNRNVHTHERPNVTVESSPVAASHLCITGRRSIRRGFNLIELLLALAISVALLAATLVALNASYIAYQRTTRAASTHTISRLAMDRMLALIRTGRDFGPLPANPNDPIVKSDLIEIITANEQGVLIEWVEAEEALYIKLFDPDTGAIYASHLLLEGVPAQYDSSNQRIKPFTLEFERGRHLYRATIDMTIVPDDNMSLQIEGSDAPVIRLVATAMPRVNALSSY